MAMWVSDRNMAIATHLAELCSLHGITDAELLPGHLKRLAEYTHVCSVIDALRDLHMSALSLSAGYSGTEAGVQLAKGLGRRTKFIWLSTRELLSHIPPSHDETLSIEVSESASKALNEIYINIRGSLDNLAWCLLAIRSPRPDERPLPVPLVELFGERFRQRIDVQEISDFLAEFDPWYSELKERRNPAAHRLPLFVLPSIQDDETVEQYNQAMRTFIDANQRAIDALVEGLEADELVANAEALREKLLGVGKFHPLFTYDDRLGFMKIYPTVPEDIGKLVSIGKAFIRHLSTNLARKN